MWSWARWEEDYNNIRQIKQPSKYLLFALTIRSSSLYESRMAFIENSTKAGPGCLSLRALPKQHGFRWKPYKSMMAFIESSTKAGWFSLKWKQDSFYWKLYESRIAFVESSTKAGSGSLSLGALRMQDGFRWKHNESRMALVESSTKVEWLLFNALWKS